MSASEEAQERAEMLAAHAREQGRLRKEAVERERAVRNEMDSIRAEMERHMRDDRGHLYADD